MRIVLTDKKLNEEQFADDIQVHVITYREMESYNNNSDVCVIVGSRAMAVKANQMNLSGLRFFQLTSTGYDGVPLDELRKKNVIVSNAGSIYSVPIAETVLFSMLLMAKRLHANPNNRHIKIHRHYSEITELFGKWVLILGAGSIGTEIAKRLLGFGMTIWGYAKRSGQRLYFENIICGKEELKKNVGNFDYVISTLPFDNNTNGLIDQSVLNVMKRTSIIVNVGRQLVFNQDDLYDALRRRNIGGAVLDMFEKIPNPVTNKFRRLSNVVVLPGVSAISQEVNDRLKDFCSCNILNYLEERIPIGIINGKK